MKKIIVLLLCLIGGSSLLAQENTVLGTGALSQASTLKYAIQQIQVSNPSGYSRPTIDMGEHTVQWGYQYLDVSQYGVYAEGYFTSTVDLGSFVPSIVGGHGSGATLYLYLSWSDGANYYYEVYSDSPGSGYVPEVTLSSSTGASYNIYTYISEDSELHIDYYDYNKTNLYTTAPTVSISFGGATATAILEGTAANGQNTAIGYQALYANSTGRENTALGHQSLYSSTGNSNLGLGYLAGNTLTTGNNNIFIGKNAGKGITTGSGNLFIGNGSNVTLNSGLNNSIIITDGNGTPRIFTGSSGTVKIGHGYDFTDESGPRLRVNGPIYSTSSLNSQHLYLSGQLSFKTTASTYYHDFLFHLLNPNTFAMRTVVDANTYPYVFTVDKNSASMTFYSPVKGVSAVNNNEFVTLGQLSAGQTIGANISGNANSATNWGGYQADFTADPTGNFVGLVGWSPTDNKYKEFNISAVKSTLGLPTSGGFDLQGVTDRNASTTNRITIIGNELKSTNSDGTIDTRFGANAFYTNVLGMGTVTDHDIVFATNASEKLRIGANGNVGIGTASAKEKLHVDGKGYFKTNSNAAIRLTSMTANEANINFEDTGGAEQTGNFSAYNFNFFTNNGNRFSIDHTGNVGIGMGAATLQEKLAVNGKIRAREVKVEPTTNWPDYVFEEGYKPLSLAEISTFVKQHKHLPEVPSAKEVEQNGLELGEMNKILLKKVEELTLHLIEKEQQLNTEKDINKKQGEEISALQQQYHELKRIIEKSAIK